MTDNLQGPKKSFVNRIFTIFLIIALIYSGGLAYVIFIPAPESVVVEKIVNDEEKAENNLAKTGQDGSSNPENKDGVNGGNGTDGNDGKDGSGKDGNNGTGGKNGTSGNNGTSGQNGNSGQNGTSGDNGNKGEKGDTGLPGLKGETGPKGDTGLQGIQGLTGATGVQGVPGLRGLTGERGLQGLTGNTGAQGIQGIQGAQGNPGVLSVANDSNITGTLTGVGGNNPTLSLGFNGMLNTTRGGTGLNSVAMNSLLIGTGGNTMYELPGGFNGQVLTIDGSGNPIWLNSASGFADPMTTAGDLLYRNGSNATTRLGVGSNDQILKVVGGLPTWSNSAGGSIGSNIQGSTATGILFAGSNGTLTQDTANFNYDAATKKLTVTGGIDPLYFQAKDVSGNNGAYYESYGGQSAALSLSNTGRIIYNSSLNKWMISENGGAYTTLSNGTFPVTSVFGRTGAITAQSGDYNTGLVTEGSNLYYTQARFNSALSAKSTADLAEGSNLYFTDARADSRVNSLFGGLFDSNLATKTSDDVTEGLTNLYFTGSRFDSALSAKSTADLAEGSNLYYTDARARGALSVSGTPLTYNSTTGVLGLNQANTTTNGYLSSTDWNTFNNKESALSFGTGLTRTGNNVTLNPSTNSLTSTTNTLTSNVNGISSSASIINSAALTSSVNSLTTTVNGVSASGVNIINSNNLSQNGTNQLVSTINGVASNALTLGVNGDVSGNLNNISVDRIKGIEVDSTVPTNNQVLIYNSTQNKYQPQAIPSAPVNSVFGRTGLVTAQSGDYNTGLVTEGSNLYYTQGRFDSALSAKSTADLAEGSNLYFTDARADSRVNSLFGGLFDTSLATKTSDDVNEGATNLYFTGSRFDSALSAKSTADLAEGSNLYFTDARADARIAAQKGLSNGLASLGSNGKVPTSQLPSLILTNTNVVASESAMLALTAAKGDIAIRSDLNKTFILSDEPASTLSNWLELLTPNPPVQSINGLIGNVSLTTSEVSEGSNLYYTDSRARGALSVAGTPLTYNSTTGVVGINQANTTTDGFLSAADWTTFNNKESALSFGTGLTRTGNNITLNPSTNTLTSAVNTLTSTANGISATASIINSNALSQNGTKQLVSTTNGVSSSPLTITTNGDVTGNLNSLTVTKIQGINVDPTVPTNNQVLVFDSSTSTYVPSALPSAPVNSVFGRTGLVTAQSGDYNTGLVTEGSNLYYTQGRFDSALSAKSTADLAEGSNLYFTDARADARVNSLFGGLFDTSLATKTTDDVTEGLTNLYFTGSRFDSALSAKSTADLAEGSNLYFTDARARGALSAGTGLSYNSTTGVFSASASSNTLTSTTNTLTSTVNGTAANASIINSNALSQNGTNQLVSTINGIASTATTINTNGDVTGNLNSLSVDKLKGIGLNFTTLTNGNLLQYDGTNFVNVAPTTFGFVDLTNNQTIAGNKTFSGESVFNGNTSISGANTLTVGTGTTALGGNLTVAGNTVSTGTLTQGGVLTANGIVNNSSLNQAGNANFGGSLTQTGTSAPSLSSAGTGKIYFDSTSNTFKVSQNGSAYVNMLSGVSGASSLSSITAATANNSIDNLNFGQDWNFSTATTQTGLNLTANALTTGKVLNVSSSSNALAANGALISADYTGTSTTGRILNIQKDGVTRFEVGANGNTGVIGDLNVAGTVDMIQALTTGIQFRNSLNFSTVGVTNNAGFGFYSLTRLTGASAQTIGGIENGIDGNFITIVNSGATTATIKNNSGAALVVNRITTGTGADVSLASGGAISLVYDSGASLWRVIGGTGSPTTSNFSSVDVADKSTGGSIGSAATTVDVATNFNVNQTTSGQTLTLPNPTNSTTTKGKIITVNNIGTTPFTIGSSSLPAGSYATAFVWNGTTWQPINAASNVAAEFGSLNSITDGQTKTGTTFSDVANGTFTIPSTGYWAINYNVVASNDTAGQGGVFRIVDSANNEVTGSVVRAGSGTAGLRFSSSQSVQIQTNAPTTYKLQWRTTASGTLTLYNDSSTSLGNTNVTYQKLSGNLPTNGQNVDYGFAKLSTNQSSNINAGSDHIKFDSIVGNVTLDTSTAYTTTTGANSIGRFTLKAGKTYSLEAGSNTNASPGNLQLYWRNADTGTQLPSSNISLQDSAIAAGSTIASSIYTPSSDTRVEVFILSNTGPSTLQAANTYAKITQLGSSASVTSSTPLSLSNFSTGGSIGVAGVTVDAYSVFDINQTTASQTLSLPNPTNTTSGKQITVNNKGTVSFTMQGASIGTNASAIFVWNGSQWNAISGGGSTSSNIVAITDKATGGTIGTAAATVDISNSFNVAQTTASQTLTLPSPTNATSGKTVSVNNTGSTQFTMYGTVISPGNAAVFSWNGTTWLPLNTNVTGGVSSEYGENTGITNNSTISGTSLSDVAGSSFTLPSAGTWKVEYNIYFAMNANNQFAVGIYDSSNAQVGNSGGATGNNNGYPVVITNSAYITTTGATTYKLRGATDVGGVTATIKNVAIPGTNTGNSKVTWQKISGYTPVTGQSVDYMYATRSTSNQSVGSSWSNQDIYFNNKVSGNIPYNTSTGVATLSAGKTYRINAGLSFAAASVYLIAYNLVDASTNTAISPTAEIVQSSNGTNNISAPQLDYIYTPTTNQTVKIRMTPGTNMLSGEQLRADIQSFLSITQLGSSAVIAGSATPFNTITAASSTNTLDNTNYDQIWNWSTATTQNGLSLGSAAQTTGSLLTLAGTSTTQTGSILNLSSASTAAVTNGLVRMNFTGAYTGNGLQVDTSTLTGNGVNIAANSLTTGEALNISSSSNGLLAGGGLLKLDYTGTSSLGNIFNVSKGGLTKFAIGADGNAAVAANLSVAGTTDITGATTIRSIGGLTLLPYNTSTGNTTELRMAELNANGTNYTGFKSPDSLAANLIYTLPGTDGTNGQSLRTNGTGTLFWASNASPFSSLTAATATNTIDNLNFAQTWNWSTATTQTGLSMAANGLTTGTALDIASNNSSLNSTNGLLAVRNVGASTTGNVFGVQANSTITNGLGVLANGTVRLGSSTGVYNGSALEIGSSSAAAFDPTVTSWQDLKGLRVENNNLTGNPSVVNLVATGADSGNWSSNLAFWTRPSGTTNPVERLRIDASGNIGIGTSSPTSTLSVAGTTSLTGINTFNGNTSVSGTNTFTVGTGATALGGTLAVTGNQTNTGSLTVGTTLGVTGATTLSNSLTQTGIAAPAVSAASQGKIYFDSTSNTFKVSQNGSAYTNLVGGGSPSVSSLTAATATNTIDNLNFAQTQNWSTLTTGTGQSYTANGLTTGTVLNISSSNNSLNSSLGLLYVNSAGTSTSGKLARFQSNSGYFEVINGGFTGINTPANVNAHLSVRQFGAAYGVEIVGDGSGATLINHLTGASTGTASIATYRNAALNQMGSITCNNTALNCSYNTTSDSRLKSNQRTTHFTLDDLMKIEVKDYTIGGANNQTGFIAQQLNDVYPQAVTVGGDNASTNPWTVDYSKVTPLLVKGMQDLNTKLENGLTANTTKVAAIEVKVQTLENRITALENKTPAPLTPTGTSSWNGGTITADTDIQANLNVGDNLTIGKLATFNGMVKFLSSTEFQDVLVKGKLDVNGKIEAKGDVNAKSNLAVDKELTVKGESNLQDIKVSGDITLNNDSAGSVIIKAGQTKAIVKFTNPKLNNKYVVSLTQVESEATGFKVTNKKLDGFEITLSAPAPDDASFDWITVSK